MKTLGRMMVGLLVTLSGCASGPVAVPMPEERYAEYARFKTWISRCGESGRVAADITARGLVYLDQGLLGYTYYPDKLGKYVQLAREHSPEFSDSECNQVAIYVGLKDQESSESSTQSRQDEQRSPAIKNTYCNQFGTQTVCSSYQY